jgi:hypothetical protein
MYQVPTFEISQLENLSKSWDKETTDILVITSSFQNKHGEASRGFHLRINGINPPNTFGQIYILGVFIEECTISRDKNQIRTYENDRGRIAYYGGTTDINMSEDSYSGPTFEVNVKGSTNTGRNAMCAILNAKIDNIIK